MRKFFLLAFLLSSCIPPEPWSRQIPAGFYSIAKSVLNRENGACGHLVRFAVISGKAGGAAVDCWDLVRLPEIPDPGFPLPARGLAAVFAYSAEQNTIRRLKSFQKAVFRGENIRWISSGSLFPDRFLVINRRYVNRSSRDALVKTVEGGSTLLTRMDLKGFSNTPFALTPKGYRCSIRKADGGYTIRLDRKEKKTGTSCGYLLPGRSTGYAVPFFRKHYFPLLISSGKGGRHQNSLKKKELEMRLRFQRVCRSASGFADGFIPKNGGMPFLVNRLLREAEDCAVPARLVLPLNSRGEPLPLPGVRLTIGRKHLWLFPVDRTSGAGTIPRGLPGKTALLISRTGSGRVLIPRTDGHGDSISLWSSITAGRSGSGSLYFSWRMYGAAASLGRSLSGLSPAMKGGRKALLALFLPRECISLNWLRVKHRVPTHHPYRGKARGWISGVLRYRKGVIVAGLSLLKRKYGRLSDAWKNRGDAFPLFSKIRAFRETVVLKLPRGVYPRRLPRRIRIRGGGVVYSARWKYISGRRYRKPRRWSWRRWALWRRRHYSRRRGKLVLYRSFRITRLPEHESSGKVFLKRLLQVDRWDEQEVKMRWR